MSKRTGSDEVDLFVGGGGPGPGSLVETSRFIAAYKQRPDYPAEVEEAREILADLETGRDAHGTPNAQSSLDHWHQCIVDLASDGTQNPHAGHAIEKARSSG